MAPPKGHPRWGGKKKGTKNRATVRHEQVIRDVFREGSEGSEVAIPPEVLALTPLEIMARVMRARYVAGDHAGALQAAAHAAPYVHARLSISAATITHTTDRSDSELAAEIEALRQRIDRARTASLLPVIEAQAEGLDNGHADLCQATAEKPHRQELDIAEPAEGE
jgi:hypothetical protein